MIIFIRVWSKNVSRGDKNCKKKLRDIKDKYIFNKNLRRIYKEDEKFKVIIEGNFFEFRK